MAKSFRFRKRTSDRSGFDYTWNEILKDDGSNVGIDERDEPPPSKISLGGEGEVSRGTYFRDSTSTAIDTDKTNPTFFITAAAGITPSFSHPYMRVTGSNDAITISANPAISIGRESQVPSPFPLLILIDESVQNSVRTWDSRPIEMAGLAEIVI